MFAKKKHTHTTQKSSRKKKETIACNHFDHVIKAVGGGGGVPVYLDTIYTTHSFGKHACSVCIIKHLRWGAGAGGAGAGARATCVVIG